MKTNKRMKKIFKMYKHKKNKKIFLISILLILLSLFIYLILDSTIDKRKNNKIVATKTIITVDGQEQKIKYIIKIKGYDLKNVVKQITFKTKQEAETEYSKYEIINRYERRGIGLELKKEKLILTMPKEQFKLDIDYKSNRTDIINQSEIKQCLINQGYEVK